MPAAGRSMRDLMLAGEPYLAADPALTAERQRALRLTSRYNAMDPVDTTGRHALLRELLAEFGEGSEILPPFHCDYGSQISVGRGSFANFGMVCLDVASIGIGDDVQIGPGVLLLTATHPVDPAARRTGWESGRPITIGDNVWLGGGVVVCPGVSIGPDSVIGAGAVVTRDIPARVLAVGNPARVVRQL